MKKHFLKLVLTLFVTVCSFAMFAAVTYAEPGPAVLDPDRFDGGNGTEKSPYEIATIEQMEYLASITGRHSYFMPDSDLYFILTADIGSKDEPLRTCLFKFGKLNNTTQTCRIYFDGNDKTVYVDIEYQDGELEIQGNIGLFGECENTTIKNLVLEGRIDAGAYNRVGGICGFAKGDVEILNCENNAVITGYIDVGGICGYACGPINISMCMNNAVITGYREVGGICGKFMEGLPNSSIEYCWNSGKVKGYSSIGGICGYFSGASNKYAESGIWCCNNKATVWGTDCVGGICGDFFGKMYGCSAQSGIIVKSTGNRGKSSNGGLLVGRLSYSKVIYSCAEQFDNTNLIGDAIEADYNNSVIILPNRFVFEFPKSIKETQVYKDTCKKAETEDETETDRKTIFEAYLHYSVLEWLGNYYSSDYSTEYYTYEPSGDGIVWNADVVQQLLESDVLNDTVAELGAVVKRGSDEEIYTKMMEIYPLWIEQIQAIRAQEPYEYIPGNSEKIDPMRVPGLFGSSGIIAKDFAEFVKVEATGDSEEILNCVLEISPDIIQGLKELIQDGAPVLSTGSTLSKGSTEILFGIGGIALGFVCGMLIGRKKKKSVLANAPEEEIEDNE